MAYRLIGLAARMCLEMGLHRRDALMKSFPNEDQWTEITRLFWTVYSLDRRWSLGTGLPFVIQDEDVDPNLPEPVCLNTQPLKTCHWLIIIYYRTRLYPIYGA